MISADLSLPIGESSCISCGTCVHVCPTGAFVDRKSAYLELPDEAESVKSTCTFCSLGCGTDLVTCYNNLVAIEGDWDATPNKGLLCVMGCFEPLYEERTRVLSPMVRRDGALEEADWDEALQVVVDRLQNSDGDLSAIASSRLTNETLALLARLFKGGLSAEVSSLERVPEFLAEPEGDLTMIDQADLIVLIGDDPTVDHQVAGMFIRRAVTNRGARLVVIGEDGNGLAPYASYRLAPGESARAIALGTAASTPVVVYGPGAGSELGQLRRALAGKAHFVGLVPGSNSRGALAVGINGAGDPARARVVYALVADDEIDESLLADVANAEFVIAQSSYFTPLTRRADVVLPTPIWSEKSGHVTNTEGDVSEVVGAIRAPSVVLQDEEILQALADRLGVTL
jgi:formate dehydrogenase major subunit